MGILARGRARGIFPGPVNVVLLALELVSPSRSLPVDSLSRSSEGGSEATRSRALFPCMPDTPAVLSSVVVCGRLTLLSFSKILLLNHDPPLHTDCDWWRGGGEAVEKRFLAYARSGS